MKFGSQEFIDRATKKGERLGRLSRFIVEKKTIIIITSVVSVILAIVGFVYYFSKHLVAGKRK